jgi:hypothetical protein
MFKIAAMLGYSERYGHVPVFVGEPEKSPDHLKSTIDVRSQFPHIAVIRADGTAWTVLKEPANACFSFIDLPFIDGNVFLDGYFQSPRYFGKSPLALPPVNMAPMFENEALRSNEWRRTCFLHVRRGDYLHPANAHHRVDLSTYYRECVKLCMERGATTCFVASDDMEWCRGELMLPATIRILFCPDDTTDCETIHWMSLCGGGAVCSNSTFSWWAAYYVHMQFPTAPVFMPQPWCRPPLPPASDLYPEWATIVDAQAPQHDYNNKTIIEEIPGPLRPPH